jgi:hypothetical protein
MNDSMRDKRHSSRPNYDCEGGSVWIGRVALFLSGAVFVLAVELLLRVQS